MLQSDAALAIIPVVVVIDFQHHFHFFGLLEYCKQELYCHRKKAVYIQTFLLNFLELFSTSVLFTDFLHIPAGLLHCLYLRIVLEKTATEAAATAQQSHGVLMFVQAG